MELPPTYGSMGDCAALLRRRSQFSAPPCKPAPGHPEIDRKQNRSRDGPPQGPTVAVGLDAHHQEHDADHRAHEVQDGVQTICDLRQLRHGLIVTGQHTVCKGLRRPSSSRTTHFAPAGCATADQLNEDDGNPRLPVLMPALDVCCRNDCCRYPRRLSA